MFQEQNAAVCIGWVRLVQWLPAGHTSELSTEKVSFAWAFTILIATEKRTDNKGNKSASQIKSCF